MVLRVYVCVVWFVACCVIVLCASWLNYVVLPFTHPWHPSHAFYIIAVVISGGVDVVVVVVVVVCLFVLFLCGVG